MIRTVLHIGAFAFLILALLASCRKTDNTFYENSSPTFDVFRKHAEPDAIYAYCASHDIYLDSIYITSPLNIKTRHYYQGQSFAMKQHFLVGDNFVYQPGTWKFIFYGRKVVNGLGFSVFIEQDF
jgi:hypothetical protein